MVGIRGRFGWALLLASSLAACGCGGRRADYSQLELIDVTGRITLDGAPLPDVHVIFEAEDKTFATAVTDRRGRYRLMYNSEQRGVKPGRKTVRIRSAGGDAEELAGEDEPPAAAGAAERLPPRYNTRSGLVVQVDRSTQRFDFELTSEP